MMTNPFITYFRDNPDYSISDHCNELDSLIARNNTIQDFLDGKIDTEYLLDFLESDGIDPEAYMESVDSEIEYLIANEHALYAGD